MHTPLWSFRKLVRVTQHLRELGPSLNETVIVFLSFDTSVKSSFDIVGGPNRSGSTPRFFFQPRPNGTHATGLVRQKPGYPTPSSLSPRRL